MGRSVSKGPYIDPRLAEKIQKAKDKRDAKPIKTWSRRSTVSPDFVGLTLMIHNGKGFVTQYITEGMVGHRLGEFAPTRTFKKHGGITKQTAELT